MSFLTLQPRFISRPFASLTQAAKIAEKDRKRVESKDILPLKQSHSTAEDAEDAEETRKESYQSSVFSSQTVRSVGTCLPVRVRTQTGVRR